MKESYEQRDSRRKAFGATVAAPVLAALNAIEPGWVMVPRDPDDDFGGSADFSRDNGERISLRYDSYGGRVHASGHYGPKPYGGGYWMPRDHKYDTTDVGISVSADRAPVAIAKDIARRLLPTYREYLGWYREDVGRALDHAATTRATFDAIMKASGGALKPHQSNKRTDCGADLSASLYDVGGVSYGTLRVSGDSVRIELTADAACAIRIAAALK